ncbi:hypothetical protein ACFL5O_01135 [Myxococcota bacterium]
MAASLRVRGEIVAQNPAPGADAQDPAPAPVRSRRSLVRGDFCSRRCAGLVILHGADGHSTEASSALRHPGPSVAIYADSLLAACQIEHSAPPFGSRRHEMHRLGTEIEYPVPPRKPWHNGLERCRKVAVLGVCLAVLPGCSDGDTTSGPTPLLPQQPPANEQAPPATAQSPSRTASGPFGETEEFRAGSRRPSCEGSTPPEQDLQIRTRAVCEHAARCADTADCTRAQGCSGCESCLDWCLCTGITDDRQQGICLRVCRNDEQRQRNQSIIDWHGVCEVHLACVQGLTCELGLSETPLPVCPLELRECYSAYLQAMGCSPESEWSFSQVAACARVAEFLADTRSEHDDPMGR